MDKAPENPKEPEVTLNNQTRASQIFLIGKEKAMLSAYFAFGTAAFAGAALIASRPEVAIAHGLMAGALAVGTAATLKSK